MKKVLFVAAVSMFFLFFISCGESDPKPTVYEDDNQISDDENGVSDDNQAGETTDEKLDFGEEEADEAVETPDEGDGGVVEVPDNNSDPFQKTGEFALSFSRQINTELGIQSRGGDGEVNFSHKGTQYTYGKLSLIVQLFPIAILQGGNVAVMWLESVPGPGAETKQVFGVMFPSTIESGATTMESAQAYVFFGDIDINVQGGQFNVKCVRSAGMFGNFNMKSYTGNNADFEASGDLNDPTAAGSQLPFPVCTD